MRASWTIPRSPWWWASWATQPATEARHAWLQLNYQHHLAIRHQRHLTRTNP